MKRIRPSSRSPKADPKVRLYECHAQMDPERRLLECQADLTVRLYVGHAKATVLQVTRAGAGRHNLDAHRRLPQQRPDIERPCEHRQLAIVGARPQLSWPVPIQLNAV